MAPTANTAGSINRITREIAHIQKGADLSLAVGCRDDDVRHVRALIVGPPDTPYEFGFFEFNFKFPKEYPIKSPNVTSITTNSGTTRFNPNIYAHGKVCLSILGTWHGEKGEEWSSAQGLESVLLSIQSLMSSNPYENEPGFEADKLDQPAPAEYARKIRHETLRIAVIQRLEKILKIENRVPETPPETKVAADRGSSDTSTSTSSDGEGDTDTPSTEPSVYEYDAEATYNSLNPAPWDPFEDLLKRRFLWYYDSYVASIEKASAQQKDGKRFTNTRFEHTGNCMPGTYNYSVLRRRIDIIRTALSDECTFWVKQGAKQVAAKTQLATQLAFQFNQLKHRYNETSYSGSRLELSLPQKDNPFAWHLTLFGRSSTNLDSGVFNISLTISPNFPIAWPRVYVETPIFHHRISVSTGALCYFPDKQDDLGSHIKAIVAAIEDKQPTYDPRAAINPEATRLLWGGETDKKTYFRKLRRSAQESSEF